MPKFRTQYDIDHPIGELFPSPSVTVPDESMTIQEIIARYTRTGSIPVRSFPSDQGGNESFEPGFDPLDFQPESIISSLTPPKPSDGETTSEGSSTSSVVEKSVESPKNGDS